MQPVQRQKLEVLQPIGLFNDTLTLHGSSVDFLAASRSLDKSGAGCTVLYLATLFGFDTVHNHAHG